MTGGDTIPDLADATVRVEIGAPEELRPRIARKLGLPLPWDQAVDELPASNLPTISGWCVLFCKLYRAIRPKRIGDRCAFEPSCSRYSEISFRAYGFRKGIALTFKRLRRCNAKFGGLDLPPKILPHYAVKLGERINEIQS